MELIDIIKERAKQNKKRIVLPEASDERVLKAASIIIEEGLAEVVLIGNVEKVMADAQQFGLTNLDKAEIVDNEISPKLEEYAKLMCEIRKSKGLTMEQAYDLLKNPLYFSTLMIKAGDADGEVAGAANFTGDVLNDLPKYQAS